MLGSSRQTQCLEVQKTPVHSGHFLEGTVIYVPCIKYKNDN